MGKKELGGIKKLKAFTSCHGGAVGARVRVVVLKVLEGLIAKSTFSLIPEWKKGLGRIEK